MKISDVTILGQGDRALILNLDDKEYLFISGKNSGALLTEIKTNLKNKTSTLEKVFEKRLMNEKSLVFFYQYYFYFQFWHFLKQFLEVLKH